MNVDKNTKLLFFDIDGTLITDDNDRILPESTVRAIRTTREKGNLAFINTGRVFCNVDPFIRDIGFDGYVCGCGGYIRMGEEILYYKKYPQDLCRKLAYMCRETDLVAIFEHSEKTCYDKTMDSPFRDKIVGYFSENCRQLIDDIDSPDFSFDKFAGWISPKTDLVTFKKNIDPYFDYIDREGNFCEMEPKGHSKATGIKFLLEYFSLPLSNAYVFGDGNNDLEMMGFVPNSICMGGGSDLALQRASYITDSVTGNGIEKAMKHFGLL
ncbi:MAG: HAD family hydrolase [Eubacterium sp.]|nr:HAD family hydrolase [Eubacterium sp.]